IRSHAQEMDEDVIRRHIALFVNEHSIDIGTEGIRAVTTLLDVGENEIFR
ncbi:MAG: 1,4-dihydroxy-6-naphthoate synthase, partial [Duncaniella sp.]|nr:1,4-dihydroxy-6-naphthoate synthase [Duncaniella sp.]